MLRAQAQYGKDSAALKAGPITLGRNLFPTLPEDKFDRGPLQRGSFSLVADVRLDNRSELAIELGLAGEHVRQMADQDILFEALLSWGESALDRIVGEFAFALWNDANQSLLLARDLFGFRPLFYHRGKKFFAFSTMPSGLHAIGNIPKDVDREFVSENLMLLPHVGSRTFFQGLERVEPASFARIDRERTSSTRYWNPAPRACAIRSAKEYEEGLRDVVEKAVQSTLRGAGDKVACQLSGGLDSSVVTSTAARLIAPKKVFAFTSVPHEGFAGPYPAGAMTDELGLARETAGLYSNIEHATVESSIDTPIASLDRNHGYYQQPSINLDNEVWGRQINQLASAKGIGVLLIGGFGNMGMSYGGLEWLSSLVSRGKLGKALQYSRALAKKGVPWRTLLAQLAGPFLPDRLWKLACALHGKPTNVSDWSAVRPDLIPSLSLRAKDRGFDPLLKPYSDPLHYRLTVLFWVDIGTYFKGVLGEWGISVRDPLADKRVIEYSLSVAPEEFIRDGIPRSLARRAFADRIPGRVAASLARGYQSPDWYEAVEHDLPMLRKEIEAISRCESAGEMIDLEWLRQTIDSWPTGGWARQDVMVRYRYGFLRAVQTGHFIRKVAGTN